MGKIADKLAAYSSDPACLRAYLGSLDSLKSSDLKKYYKVMTDFDFINAKVKHSDFGVQSLIEDYDLINNSELLNKPEYNAEQIKTLKLIQEALRLSAHILKKDKMQLAGQFCGRMQHFEVREIQVMLKVAKQQVLPWLRPLTSNLISPGGSLRLTFTGHSRSVNAVAITPDGKRVISASYDNTLKLWNLETGEEIATFTGEAPFLCCAVAPDGVTIVAGESSGRVHFLRLENV